MNLRDTVLQVLGALSIAELTGGHQARVFRVTRSGGDPVIAKVVDAADASAAGVQARVEAMFRLAELDPQVCRPVRHAGAFVTRISADDAPAGLLTCHEFAEGREPDPLDTADAVRMGQSLARLHRSMRSLPAADLPLVAALRDQGPLAGGPVQLLHGDFSAGNLRFADDAVRIFDLDDCGQGPVEFEIANTLYMVLFDAVVNGRADTFRRFAGPFTSAYRDAAGADLDDGVVTHFIERRISALERWLDDLPSAPVGIRNATPAWRDVLRAFVRDPTVRTLYEGRS